MTRYNYRGFYGDYGHMIVHNDGTTNLEMICEDKDITSMELIQVFLEILDYYEDLDLDQWL